MSLNDYDKETTDASFQLLKKFLDLTNEKNIPIIIIGGWATEAFKEGIGSKDIDVIMLNDADVEKLKKEKFFDKDDVTVLVEQIYPLRYKKQISVNGKSRTIICDIFCAEYPRDDYESLGIEIHWCLTKEFKEQRKIRGVPVWVPKRDLLIILKIIAAVDRSARLDRKPEDEENLQSKIWKDYRDIAFLVADQELDKNFLKKYIKSANLTKRMENFLSRYKQPENKEVLDELGLSPEKMEDNLKF